MILFKLRVRSIREWNLGLHSITKNSGESGKSMQTQRIDKVLEEFEYALSYLMKIASDLKSLTSVSTEVLKRDDRERQIQTVVRAKFLAKAKAARMKKSR